MTWAENIRHRRPLTRLHVQPAYRDACRFQASLEGFLAGAVARRRYWQHLFLRIAVARAPGPAPPRQHLATARSASPSQSNCVRSRACLRMLSTSGARLSQSGMVVSRVGNNSSRLRPRRKTLPPLRRADPAHCAGWPVDLLLRALSEIGANKG